MNIYELKKFRQQKYYSIYKDMIIVSIIVKTNFFSKDIQYVDVLIYQEYLYGISIVYFIHLQTGIQKQE